MCIDTKRVPRSDKNKLFYINNNIRINSTPINNTRGDT